MPALINSALLKHRLMRAYAGRPAYQRNDYISWIMRAKLAQTRQRRLEQMPRELRWAGIYMKMKWTPRRQR